MNKNLVIIVLVLLVLVVVGYYFFIKFRAPTLAPELPQPPTPPVLEVSTTPTSSTIPTPSTTSTATPTTEVTPKKVIIKIMANGFEPKEVEITKGTKVTWVNEQPNPSWPASAVHPTHEVYPGSSIKKCGTPEQGKIFDACHGLQQGESWSFVFNEVGDWYYHDHLSPSWKGEIEVK
jgi:plastocyanin